MMPPTRILGALIVLLGITANVVYASPSSLCTPQWDNYAIEFVYVQDGRQDSYSSFVESLKDHLMGYLVRKMKSKFTSARFGLTSFCDWASRTLHYSDSCYTFQAPLTSDVDLYLNYLKKAEILCHGNRNIANSLMATALSVTDDNMGWGERVTPDGKKIIRIVAVHTDSPSIMPSDLYFGREYHGDKSDSCDSKAPSPEMVGTVLNNRNIMFLGLVSYKDTIDVWMDYLKRMDVRGVVQNLEMYAPDTFVSVVMEGIQELLCSIEPSTTTTTTEKTKTTSPPKTTLAPTVTIHATSSKPVTVKPSTKAETTHPKSATTKHPTTKAPGTTKPHEELSNKQAFVMRASNVQNLSAKDPNGQRFDQHLH